MRPVLKARPSQPSRTISSSRAKRPLPDAPERTRSTPRGHHGHNSQGHNQGEGRGNRGRNGDVTKELTGFVLDKDNGEKHRQVGQRRRQNRAPHFAGAIQRRLGAGLAHLPVAKDVLEHHDRVVHHIAYGKGQAGQHDDVQGASEGILRTMNVVMTESGIDRPMTRRLLGLRRKKSRTRIVSSDASYRFSVTRCRAS